MILLWNACIKNTPPCLNHIIVSPDFRQQQASQAINSRLFCSIFYSEFSCAICIHPKFWTFVDAIWTFSSWHQFTRPLLLMPLWQKPMWPIASTKDEFIQLAGAMWRHILYTAFSSFRQHPFPYTIPLARGKSLLESWGITYPPD